MTGTWNFDTPTPAPGPSESRLRVAEARDRARRELEHQGVRLGRKEPEAVVRCPCGYEGFALERRLLGSRCPACGKKPPTEPPNCYDLPIPMLQSFIEERGRLGRSRRWSRAIGTLLATTGLIALISFLTLSVGVMEPARMFFLQRDLHADIRNWGAWINLAGGQRTDKGHDIEKRKDAVIGLSQRGQKGLRLLVEELAGDQPDEMKRYIADLIKKNEISGVQALEWGLFYSGRPDVPRQCVVLLAQMKHWAVGALQKGLSSSRADLRGWVLDEVEKNLESSPTSGAEILEFALTQPTYEDVATRSAPALGRLGIVAAGPLNKGLESPHESTRAAARGELVRLGLMASP